MWEQGALQTRACKQKCGSQGLVTVLAMAGPPAVSLAVVLRIERAAQHAQTALMIAANRVQGQMDLVAARCKLTIPLDTLLVRLRPRALHGCTMITGLFSSVTEVAPH